MPPRPLTPLIIACALFMENLDGTVLSTSLPAIAKDLHEDPVALKLAMTSYLLSLAVFIPASGWAADRFGARRVFRAAIAVFTLGSVLCGLSSTLAGFVAARMFQGLGGAMMVPVGRLVLLRAVPRHEIVQALATLAIRPWWGRSWGRRWAASSQPICTGAGSSGSTCRWGARDRARHAVHRRRARKAPAAAGPPGLPADRPRLLGADAGPDRGGAGLRDAAGRGFGARSLRSRPCRQLRR